MPISVLETPLFYPPITGNNPREWINKKMAKERRVLERPTGHKLLPFGIYDIMRNTVGFADPKAILHEVNKAEQKSLYPDPKRLARTLLRKPTLMEQGRKHQEEVIGGLRSRKLTEYEFLARRKITKSLIKLANKLAARMRIVLLVDHEETLVKEKAFFNERLAKKKELILKEMNMRLPNEEEYTRAALMKERAKIIYRTKELLDEEIAIVKKLKETYLKNAYEFQINWLLKNVGDFYHKKMNAYSLKWREMLEDLRDRLEREDVITLVTEENTSFYDLGNMKVLIEELSKEWKQNIVNTENDFEIELKKLEKQLQRIDKSIASEKLRKGNILEIIKMSSSIVRSIIEQYEKLVVYAYRDKPGVCNFFLSFEKLQELNNEFINKALRKKNTYGENVDISGLKSSQLQEERSEEAAHGPSRESSSFEIHQFKECKDVEKLNVFRTNVLKVKDLLEEIKCAVLREPFHVLEKMADTSAELKTFSDTGVEANDSKYILDKITDAYRLLESDLRKSTTSPMPTPELTEDDTVSMRVESIVKCFKRHPHMLTSFASV